MSEAHSALVHAAVHDDVESIREAEPSLVNVVDHDGKTALFYALYRSGATNDDDPRVVAALLEIGADPNLAIVRRDGPRSPLHQAAIRSLSNVATTLVGAGANPSEGGLLHAACEGALGGLAELAMEQIDVNARYRGATALHEACYSGSPTLVEILLRRGADPGARVEGGEWASFDTLDFAIIGNNPQVVASLLRVGVDVRAEHLRHLVDPARTWPLPIEEAEDVRDHLLGEAVQARAPGAPALRIAELLADTLGEDVAAHAVETIELAEPEQAATPKAPPRSPIALPDDELGRRAWLRDAATYGWADRLRQLPRDVNVDMLSTGTADDVARPPLCVAAALDDRDVARALLELGADPRVRGADNRSAYRVARTRAMRALLREFGPVW